MAHKKKRSKKPCAQTADEESQCTEDGTTVVESTFENIVGHVLGLRSSSGIIEQGPQISPYTEAPVALHIGFEKTVYYVPRHLLPSVWSKTVGEDPIPLYDVEMETGHTLVHYLYTRKYQTLDTVVDSTLDACGGLRRTLHVYIMVNNYNIPGLRELALRHIEHLCARLDIFEILATIESDFVKLGPDTPVHAFLHKKAKTTFEKDHTVFACEAFLGCLDNAALRSFMLRCVMTLYSDKVSHITNTKRETCQKLDECDETIRDLSAEAATTEQYMTVQQEFLTPLANEHDSIVEERCDEEAFVSETTSTEGFCTISCPSCNDSIEPSRYLDRLTERFDELVESLEEPLVCEEELPTCVEELPACLEEPLVCVWKKPQRVKKSSLRVWKTSQCVKKRPQRVRKICH